MWRFRVQPKPQDDLRDILTPSGLKAVEEQERERARRRLQQDGFYTGPIVPTDFGELND